MEERIEEVEERLIREANEIFKSRGVSMAVIIGVGQVSEDMERMHFRSRLTPRDTLKVLAACAGNIMKQENIKEF